MGCGESKHDVTTGNTISRHKKLSLTMKRNKALEAIPEADVNDIVVQQPEFENTDKDFDSEKAVALADVKDITVNTELNDGDIEDPGEKDDVFVGDHEHGRSISRDSPNHFFSSRKDEDAVEAIVAEDRLEYFSPHHQPNQEVEWKVSQKRDDAVEEKDLDDEVEKRAEDENGNPKDLKEAILIKEAKVVTTIAAMVKTPIEDKSSLAGVKV